MFHCPTALLLSRIHPEFHGLVTQQANLWGSALEKLLSNEPQDPELLINQSSFSLCSSLETATPNITSPAVQQAEAEKPAGKHGALSVNACDHVKNINTHWTTSCLFRAEEILAA